MIFLLRNNKNKLLIIYIFLLFALTILVGFLSIPLYTFDKNVNYSQIYITDQNYLGQTYSSALENNDRNLIYLRLALRSIVVSQVFILLLKSPRNIKDNVKGDFNPVILMRKLKRILIMKQNSGVYKSIPVYNFNIQNFI